MKRLFLGFPVHLPSALQHAYKRAKISAQQREMEFYWPPPANLHVTVCFIGATPDDRLQLLQRTVNNVVQLHPPFETTFRGLGAFPDDHHMRVLYAGVRKSKGLTALQTQLAQALVQAGFAQEDRDYVPHLTLGRLRKARSGRDLISPHVRTQFGELQVGALDLFESVTQGSHPVYKILSTHALTGTATLS